MPILDISSKFCAPRAAWASGSSLGHVPAHLASPGNCGAAGALLHARLELGDHWHLCPDRDGSWYGVFSLPSGLGGPLWTYHVWSAHHVPSMACWCSVVCLNELFFAEFRFWYKHCFGQWELKAIIVIKRLSFLCHSSPSEGQELQVRSYLPSGFQCYWGCMESVSIYNSKLFFSSLLSDYLCYWYLNELVQIPEETQIIVCVPCTLGFAWGKWVAYNWSLWHFVPWSYLYFESVSSSTSNLTAELKNQDKPNLAGIWFQTLSPPFIDLSIPHLLSSCTWVGWRWPLFLFVSALNWIHVCHSFAFGFSFSALILQKNWSSVYLPLAPYFCTAAAFYLVLNSILQDFHETPSGILFVSVVLLKTFCPYLFCLMLSALL